MRFVAILILFSLLLPPLFAAGRELTDEEMERAVYILHWAIAYLAKEIQDVLLEVRQTDVNPALKARIDEAIEIIQKILEVLGVKKSV